MSKWVLANLEPNQIDARIMPASATKEFLDRFGGLDGALVLSISFSAEGSREERTVTILLKAFCEGEDGEKGWHHVTLRFSNSSIFAWLETSRNTNLVLNWPVEVVEWEDCEIIDFDPLHAREDAAGLKLSSCFAGGRKISFEFQPIPSGGAMDTKHPFATSLVLGADEEPNTRALELIQSFQTSPSVWILEGLDATGLLGANLTEVINASGYKQVSHAEFCDLLGEAGQVIEVDALALGKDHELLARIEIADGSILNWLGFGEPAEEGNPGDFRREDCGQFYWPASSQEVLRIKSLEL